MAGAGHAPHIAQASKTGWRKLAEDRREHKGRSDTVDQQTKAALKQDKFVSTTTHGLEWAKENRQSVLFNGGIVLAAILITVLGAVIYNSRSEAASVAFGAAMQTYQTPLAPPGAPIPLSLPPLSSPPAFAKPGTPAAQPGRAPPTIVAKLPTPTLSGDASPGDFLRAARGALAAGRNGEARSALEMAQTRLLSREVDAGKESIPSKNLAVTQISEAIGALAANDRMACLRYIEFASHTIGSPLD